MHLQHRAPFVTRVSVNEVHRLVLFTTALRSILVLQLCGERRVSQSIGESVNRGERGRESPVSHNSRAAAAAQVRHDLGMQAMMQAHSDPADCDSTDVTDLCCER